VTSILYKWLSDRKPTGKILVFFFMTPTKYMDELEIIWMNAELSSRDAASVV
jgi:hypothetical protein